MTITLALLFYNYLTWLSLILPLLWSYFWPPTLNIHPNCYFSFPWFSALTFYDSLNPLVTFLFHFLILFSTAMTVPFYLFNITLTYYFEYLPWLNLNIFTLLLSQPPYLNLWISTLTFHIIFNFTHHLFSTLNLLSPLNSYLLCLFSFTFTLTFHSHLQLWLFTFIINFLFIFDLYLNSLLYFNFDSLCSSSKFYFDFLILIFNFESTVPYSLKEVLKIQKQKI